MPRRKTRNKTPSPQKTDLGKDTKGVSKKATLARTKVFANSGAKMTVSELIRELNKHDPDLVVANGFTGYGLRSVSVRKSLFSEKKEKPKVYLDFEWSNAKK